MTQIDWSGSCDEICSDLTPIIYKKVQWVQSVIMPQLFDAFSLMCLFSEQFVTEKEQNKCAVLFQDVSLQIDYELRQVLNSEDALSYGCLQICNAGKTIFDLIQYFSSQPEDIPDFLKNMF